MAMAIESCGCCGRGILRGTSEWCTDCLPHIDTNEGPLWQQTWFAQNGNDCPFTDRATVAGSLAFEIKHGGRFVERELPRTDDGDST
jgi:hypothetical protein